MKNKKSWDFAIPLLFVLLLIGIIIRAVLTQTDKESLKDTLKDTTSFAKVRLNDYDNYTANDRVKSLVRLLDKTKELSSDMKRLSSYNKEDLEDYVEQQRLDGVFILDKNLNIILQDTKDNTQTLWQEIVNKDYIKEILEHSEETYTERIQIESTAYDFAVVPRQDVKGLVIAYAEKDSKTTGDITIDSVFEKFPISMNGIIVVCSDGKVISTNQSALLGKTDEQLNDYYDGSLEGNKEGIIELKSKDTTWYGSRDKMKEYTIYIFFPAAQVFMTRTIVWGLYVAIAILGYMLLMLVRSNIEKSALRQSQKRMRIINALGKAYSSITLFDLSARKTEIIKRLDEEKVEEGSLFEKESLQKHINDIIAPDYQDGFLQFLDMDTIQSRLQGQQFLTYTSQTRKGTWQFSVLVPQRFDENGNIICILLANRDITDEKKKEREQEKALRTALAVAEHANKAKTNFLNSISHDIRTPMNAVIGFTALATAHIDNKELVVDYLRKINVSSRHLLSLINDVLDMNRIESGVVKLEKVRVHLPDSLHDLQSIIQGGISAKQQELYIDIQDVVHEDIITDKLRLNQVLLNIVSNATKFTPVGGMIHIRISESPSNREGYSIYTFSVKDNGIGMSEEFKDHIFDAFAREQTATKSGIQGTGLGLAIAKNIVDMMGGTIEVKSELGKGSEFIVTIECELSKEKIEYKPVPELQGSRALVVDDDANICMSVCKMLREIEMVADWTTSGKEAILRTREAYEMKKEFKAYIIDYQMPDMNGIETVRRIRKIIGDDTPIIILTAYDWSELAEEAKEAGVTAFVSKPLFMSELRSVLTKQVVKEQEEKQENHHAYAGKKILLVEDNELNREIATSILEDEGMIVDSVEDGTDAVARMNVADESEYDVILMDIQMPKMDGYTATREIRTLKNNKKANIPIIAMTANAFEEDKQKAFKAGMNAHIAKPINIEIILQTFDQVFGEVYGQE